MPTYELSLLLRKKAQPATVAVIKRAVGEIYTSGYIRSEVI